uniref:BPTI/Kunitz inhibitor domain-containing protein n=1 Tax=Romanomermis culicivorax TaxID=13658 RepID=A0A915I4J1_ROMCU
MKISYNSSIMHHPDGDVCSDGRAAYIINESPIVCAIGHYGSKGACPKGCPPGYGALKRVETCSPIPDSCPEGYFCSYDTMNESYTCCGKPNNGTIPQEERELVCHMQHDEGETCERRRNTKKVLPSRKWYFDKTSGVCKSFRYNGCNGNQNNFESKRDCSTYCIDGQDSTFSKDSEPKGFCPNGFRVQLNDRTRRAKICRLGAKETGCDDGYYCTYSLAANNYFCCHRSEEELIQRQTSTTPTEDSNGCPVGEAYLYPRTQTPLLCDPVTSECPRGYTCMPSLSVEHYQCCSQPQIPDFLFANNDYILKQLRSISLH